MLGVLLALLALGSPVQRPAQPGWFVPVYVREFDGGSLDSVEVSADAPGLVGVGIEAASYLSGATAAVVSDGDTLVLRIARGADCGPTGPQGLLAWLHLTGRGSIMLAGRPSLFDCLATPLPGDALPERVLVPPEQPIPVIRSTWGQVKRFFR